MRIPLNSSTRLAGSSRTIHKIVAFFLLALAFQACSQKDTTNPSPAPVSSADFVKLAKEYGFDATRSSNTPGVGHPFTSEKEARDYLAALRDALKQSNAGSALQALDQKYFLQTHPGAATVAPAVRLVSLKDNQDIFQGSQYKGYRYAVIDADRGSAQPIIMELVVRNGGTSTANLEALATRLYVNSKQAPAPAQVDNFTGYVFLYNRKYQYTSGTSYSNGIASPNRVSIVRARDGVLPPGSVIAPLTRKQVSALGCVHWIEYYGSDGSYITTNCLEYADDSSGSTWFGTDPGTGTSSDPGTVGGGGISGGGSTTPDSPDSPGNGGNGNGTYTVADDNSAPEQGLMYMQGPISFFSSFYIIMDYSGGKVNNFYSGFASGAGFDTWEQLGSTSSYSSHVYNFQIMFKITIKIDDYILKTWGPNAISGTANVQAGTYQLRSPF